MVFTGNTGMSNHKEQETERERIIRERLLELEGSIELYITIHLLSKTDE